MSGVQNHLPWLSGQVRVADSWPSRRDQPVSVALAPAGDRLALSVGQRLSVSPLVMAALGEPIHQLSCALSPGLSWSPSGDRLAFRDEEGNGRIIDLSDRSRASNDGIWMLGLTSVMAFAPNGDQLATLSPSLPGRMTLALIKPDRETIWELALTRNRMSGNHSEGINLAWSPNGRFLACTTGTSMVWLIDATDGGLVAQFDNHTLTVTGLSWIDDNWILSASQDATLQLWRPDRSMPAVVVETIPAVGMVFVRAQRAALIWSADGGLFAWDVAEAPTQLWYRDSPVRSVAAHFTRLAVSAVSGLLALVNAGSTDLILVTDWDQTASAPAATTTY